MPYCCFQIRENYLVICFLGSEVSVRYKLLAHFVLLFCICYWILWSEDKFDAIGCVWPLLCLYDSSLKLYITLHSYNQLPLKYDIAPNVNFGPQIARCVPLNSGKRFLSFKSSIWKIERKIFRFAYLIAFPNLLRYFHSRSITSLRPY